MGARQWQWWRGTDMCGGFSSATCSGIGARRLRETPVSVLAAEAGRIVSLFVMWWLDSIAAAVAAEAVRVGAGTVDTASAEGSGGVALTSLVLSV